MKLDKLVFGHKDVDLLSLNELVGQTLTDVINIDNEKIFLVTKKTIYYILPQKFDKTHIISSLESLKGTFITKIKIKSSFPIDFDSDRQVIEIKMKNSNGEKGVITFVNKNYDHEKEYFSPAIKRIHAGHIIDPDPNIFNSGTCVGIVHFKEDVNYKDSKKRRNLTETGLLEHVERFNLSMPRDKFIPKEVYRSQYNKVHDGKNGNYLVGFKTNHLLVDNDLVLNLVQNRSINDKLIGDNMVIPYKINPHEYILIFN